MLLEPVMRVEVVVPNEHSEDVICDLLSRHGKIQLQEDRRGTQIVHARVPLSAMLGYATDLRSRTEGRATYSMHFDRYERPNDREGPDDPMLREPRRPVRPLRSSTIALPEPDSSGHDECVEARLEGVS